MRLSVITLFPFHWVLSHWSHYIMIDCDSTMLLLENDRAGYLHFSSQGKVTEIGVFRNQWKIKEFWWQNIFYWVFSKLFTWIQVITWITHTEFGQIRTILGPNSTIFRTIQGQTQPFLEQYNWPISSELKLVCVIHVITVIQAGRFEKNMIIRMRQYISITKCVGLRYL